MKKASTNSVFWGISIVLLSTGLLLLIRLTCFHQEPWSTIDIGYLGYQKLIFVGDSRVMDMKRYNIYDDVEFIGKNGEGLDWFEEEGYEQLMKKLKANQSPQPIAVIFNLGINDYKYNGNDYLLYFQQIAKELKNQNCYLFYMSVNPVDEQTLREEKHTPRTNREIDAFNTVIREGLDEDYVWLDMNTRLKEQGFATRDGLHYTGIISSYVLTRGIQMALQEEAYPQEYCWCQRGGEWYAIRWENNSRVKDQWIYDGEGIFYLDEEGRLVRNQNLSDENGMLCKIGNSGRKELK